MKYLKLFEQFEDDEDEEDDDVYSDIDKFFNNLRNGVSINIYKFIDDKEVLETTFFVETLSSDDSDGGTVTIKGYPKIAFELENGTFNSIERFYGALGMLENTLKIRGYYGAYYRDDCHFKKDDWERFKVQLAETFPPFKEEIEAMPKCYPIPTELVQSLIGKKIKLPAFDNTYTIKNIEFKTGLTNSYTYKFHLESPKSNKTENITDIEIWALLDTGVCDLDSKYIIVK